jgi:predicted phage tail protein
MTKINLHGILKYEFGEIMPLSIDRPKEVIDAIDSIKKNFRARIYELARENIHFNIIVDGESIKNINQLEMKKNFKQIDIVPIIAGGAFWVVVQIALLVISIALQMMMRPKPPKPQQLTSEISGSKQSFMIATKGNLTQQGTPVPVGYGRLRVGSNIIQTSIKSYPQNQAISTVITENPEKTQTLVSQYAIVT